MPIIFEQRLGNSDSDNRLRKIYSLHNKLATIYTTIFIGAMGLCMGSLLIGHGNPIIGFLVLAATIAILVVYVRSQQDRSIRR